MDDIKTICRRAETLLARSYPDLLHLEVLEQFESSHTVLRCAVQWGTAGQVPGTVIVKQRTVNPPGSSQGFDQAVLFSNEWASLDFLAALPRGNPVGPRLYDSDRQAGLVVLEDLGGAQTVQDMLYSTDRQAAIDALAEMGKTIGRLQWNTSGHEPEFTARQAALAASTTMSDASRDCRNNLTELHACMDALGIDVNQQFDSAMHNLESVIHGLGIFRAFVHNDAGPHNFVVTASGARLLDFEFAGYGHGMLDVVCARLAFPPSFRGRVLPETVVRQVEESYRAEMAEQLPEISDDNMYAEAITQGCAHWAFSKLIGFWNAYLQERLAQGEARDTRAGSAPERSAFFRRQVFTYLRLALSALEEYDHLPELRLALAQIIERLLRIWPETPFLSGYPAFGGEEWHYP